MGFDIVEPGQTETALRLHEERLTLARASNDLRAEAWALADFGSAYLFLNRHVEALVRSDESLLLMQRLEDSPGLVSVRQRIADILIAAGDPAAAIRQLSIAEEIAQDMGDTHSVAAIAARIERLEEEDPDSPR